MWILCLRWNPPCANGDPITKYVLESDSGRNGSFSVVYEGPSKSYKLLRLQPATTYRLRLAAVNSHGPSKWSRVVAESTFGGPPPQPAPPSCVKVDVGQVTLAWVARPGDERFSLQMEEVGGPHGFIPQYDDRGTSCVVSELKRNSLYRFRVSFGLIHYLKECTVCCNIVLFSGNKA
jgi:hypothetical protein